MRRLGQAVASAVVCLLACPFPSHAAPDGEAVFSRVVSAEVRGLVFYADGETPAADLPVRIWDIAKRDFVFETTTDENGFFKFPTLKPGNYYVTFDWMKVELEVVDNTTVLEQQPDAILVVIPRGFGFLTINQLNTLLIASSLSEMAAQYDQPKKPVIVSP